MIPRPGDSYHRLPWPIVIGHRGCRTRADENTLDAVEAAADAGADGVEVDVRLCASGELVVAHDANLERVTGGADGRAVALLSLSELARVPLAGGGRIPTLLAVSGLCRDRGLCLNVELKRDVPSRVGVVSAAARLLRSFEGSFTVVVSSFDPAMLVGFRMLAAEVPTALLLDHQRLSARLGILVRALGAVAVHAERRLVTDRRLRLWHDAGLRVIAWTVNDSDEAARLVEIGIDGLISDDPALARRALARVRPSGS